jgi:predicted phage replisome organizer
MNNKRYWLKVKENFFDDDEIVFLKSQKNGYEYIYLWMRILLKCLRSNEERDCGFLRINEKVPYDINMLSNLFGINIDIVRTGIEVFKQMGMLEILDDGTYYIEAVQKMIGKEGESAERMRISREKKKVLQLSQSDTDVTEKCIIKSRVEEEKEEEVEKKKKYPTIEEFKTYIIEKSLNLNAEKLYEYYTEGNWHDSKGNKVKNWKQKLLALNSYSKDKQNGQTKPSDNYKNVEIV